MTLPENWCPDGMLEGAALFGDGGSLSRIGVVGFAHSSGRVGLVRDRGTYFRAEYLVKVHPPGASAPRWEWHTPFAFCGNEPDAQSLIEAYVATGEIPTPPKTSRKLKPLGDAS